MHHVGFTCEPGKHRDGGLAAHGVTRGRVQVDKVDPSRRQANHGVGKPIEKVQSLADPTSAGVRGGPGVRGDVDEIEANGQGRFEERPDDGGDSTFAAGSGAHHHDARARSARSPALGPVGGSLVLNACRLPHPNTVWDPARRASVQVARHGLRSCRTIGLLDSATDRKVVRRTGRCPDCRALLDWEASDARCSGCGRRFLAAGGVPSLLPKDGGPPPPTQPPGAREVLPSVLLRWLEPYRRFLRPSTT